MLDLSAIQNGTVWQIDWLAVPVEGLAALTWSDVVVMRRSLDALDRMTAEVPSFANMRDTLRVGYSCRSGAHKPRCTCSVSSPTAARLRARPYLFLLTHGRLELAASLDQRDPPADLAGLLSAIPENDQLGPQTVALSNDPTQAYSVLQASQTSTLYLSGSKAHCLL